MAILKSFGAGSDPRAGGRGAAPSVSIVGPGMNVVGELVSQGSIRVEGAVRGTIRARSVMVVRGGVVDGDVFAEQAVVGGEVTGSIVATKHLELQGTCAVSGEIVSPVQHLNVESGARFSGNIRMLEEGEEGEVTPLPVAATQLADARRDAPGEPAARDQPAMLASTGIATGDGYSEVPGAETSGKRGGQRRFAGVG
jgi:cytoskeletal protein CcmA (bactofilin family)